MENNTSSASFYESIPKPNKSQNKKAMSLKQRPSEKATSDQPAAVPTILEKLNTFEYTFGMYPIYGRSNVIQDLLIALKTYQNPGALLIGESGSGKTAIINELARAMCQPKGTSQIKTVLDNTDLYQITTSELLNDTSLRGQLESKLTKLANYITDRGEKTIIVVDNINQLLNATGVIEALTPLWSLPLTKVILVVTPQELRQLNNSIPTINNFQKVYVTPFGKHDMDELLLLKLPEFRQDFNVKLEPNDVKNITKLAAKYDLQTAEPKGTLSLIYRSVATYCVTETLPEEGSLHLTYPYIESVAKGLYDTNGIQPGAIERFNDLTYANMIGQKEAITSIRNTIAQLEDNLYPRNKPQAFIFAGYTGTGKTHLAKLLSEALYQKDNSFIRLDMTEFTDAMSLTRITGSSDGYIGSDTKRPLIFDKLLTDSHYVILLDELEKAHSDVTQWFLQALDEGKATTMRGEVIDFSKSIIIATTNAGTKDAPKVGFDQTSMESFDIELLQNHFPPEFLNRFDHTIGFSPLSQDEYAQVLATSYNDNLKAMFTHTGESFGLKPIPTDIIQNTPSELPLFITKAAKETFDPKKNGRPGNKVTRDIITAQVATYREKEVSLPTPSLEQLTPYLHNA